MEQTRTVMSPMFAATTPAGGPSPRPGGPGTGFLHEIDRIVNPLGPNMPSYPQLSGQGIRALFREIFKEGTLLNFVTKTGLTVTVVKKELEILLSQLKDIGVGFFQQWQQGQRAEELENEVIRLRELLRSQDDDPAGQGVVADLTSRIDP